jgi:hypothetical protein
MKTITACFALLISIFSFSQPNLRATEMKKKGVKKLQVFCGEMDTPFETKNIPCRTFYYDHEGRLLKHVELFPEGDTAIEYWRIIITEFDTLGRITRYRFNYGSQPDPDQANFTEFIEASYFSYEGDSVTVKTDTSWRYGKIDRIEYSRQAWHWERLKAPKPRPILWPDSLCSHSIITSTEINYEYETPEAATPRSIDTVKSSEEVYQRLQNNSITRHETDLIVSPENKILYEHTGRYTLNLRYDTAYESNTTYAITENGNKEFSDQFSYTTTYDTKRTGARYTIKTHVQEHDSDQARALQNYTETSHTSNPWREPVSSGYYYTFNIADNSMSIYREPAETNECKNKFTYW